LKRPPSTLWLVSKPVGVTSFECMKAVRDRQAGPWPLKAVHGGVLDPFASGLLVVLVGAATRLFDQLHHPPKLYRATVCWGVETDTGDAGGRPVGAPGPVPTPGALEAALAPFVGWTDQVPPATSNKRVAGERAYVRAHRGEAVFLPASRVYLHSARWTAHEGPTSTLEVTVRGGFYVRSLARDLGRALGTGAHLTGLERLAIGPWQAPEAPQAVRGPAVLPWLPMATLSDAQWGEVRAGRLPRLGAPAAPQWPLPEGYPVPEAVGLVHLGRLVAVAQGQAVTLLPGGV
jgi:tRNA pseudouridine55 synthase